MLQKLNERIQGVIAWLVIGMIALTFTLFGLDYYMQAHQNTDVKATVNGTVISNQAFENNYRRARAQRDPSKFTAKAEKRLRNEVLETMISNEVAVTAARESGFQISAEQANAAILGIPQFQEDGQFSTERYQQALNGALFTPESFQTEVRQGMLLNQQRFAFMGTAFVLPYETVRFVKLYMQTRDYDYLVIPSSLFKDNVQITSEEVKQFYESHQSEFQSPEKVSIEYVQLSMPEVRSSIKVTDEDIKNYYDENGNNFLMPAQWQVAHIFFALPENASESVREEVLKKAEDVHAALQVNPTEFVHWVKTVSDDKLSLSNEGVLPWIIAGQQPEFDKALVNLVKPDQMSPLIKTAHGYELFKLKAYKPAKTKPLNEVQGIIKEQLQTELAQTHYAQLLEQLSDLSYQTPDSLDSVSKTLKMPIKKTEFFSAQEGNDDLTRNKAVVSAAFSHDVLDLNNNSEPVQINNESVVVLRVNKHIPASKKPLDEVTSAITTSLVQEKASTRAKELGEQLLDSKIEAIQFIKNKNLKWSTVENAARDAADSAPVNNIAYMIPKPGVTKGEMLSNGDFVLVKLKQINPGKIEALDKEQISSLAQQMEASYGMMDYDLYLNRLIQNAKIEKHA